MSDDRKPLWPWIVALLIGAMVYVGAAPSLMYVSCEVAEPYRTWAYHANCIYRPLWFLLDHCPPSSHVWYQYMDHWR